MEFGLTGILDFLIDRRLKQAIKHWGRNPFTDLPIARFPMLSHEPYIPLLLLLLLHIRLPPQHFGNISGKAWPEKDQNSSGTVISERSAWSVPDLDLYSGNNEPGSETGVQDNPS